MMEAITISANLTGERVVIILKHMLFLCFLGRGCYGNNIWKIRRCDHFYG